MYGNASLLLVGVMRPRQQPTSSSIPPLHLAILNTPLRGHIPCPTRILITLFGQLDPLGILLPRRGVTRINENHVLKLPLPHHHFLLQYRLDKMFDPTDGNFVTVVDVIQRVRHRITDETISSAYR
jgi:hypothetical protein